MNTVYLLTGGNLGNRHYYLKRAAEIIEEKAGRITRTSSLYETEPWGFRSFQYFLNQALLLETKLDPQALLKELLVIEDHLGKLRNVRGYKSRSIDIDLLFFNNQTIRQAGLVIPHDKLHLRKFALYPMAEIAPGLIHPVLGKTIRELLEQCNDDHLVRKYMTVS